jgi:hypothetical protein
MTTVSENPTLSAVAAADATRIEAERATATKTSAASQPLLSVSGTISAPSDSDNTANGGSPTTASKIDLGSVGATEAKTIMSAEHKALGYRPPPGSLAAEAQAAAAKHPDAHLDVDPNTLRELAREDAARIAAERKTGDVAAAVETHSAIDLEQVGEGECCAVKSGER